MSAIDELILRLKTESGETLHRAIVELGNRGPAARDAYGPLREVVRFHDDPVASGEARLIAAPGPNGKPGRVQGLFSAAKLKQQQQPATTSTASPPNPPTKP